MHKIIILGDNCIGKTSICKRQRDNTFRDEYICTIAVEMSNIECNNHKLQVWDLSGLDRYKSIVSAYYRIAHGIVLVYDITNRKSFLNLDYWIDDVLNYYSIDDMPMVYLVGTKLDLEDDRKVFESDVNRFIKKYGIIYYTEVSSKYGLNVDKLFDDIVDNIVKLEIPPIRRTTYKMSVEEVRRVDIMNDTCCNII